ncbi:hypothetical protein ACRAJ3_25110 [Rhodococcus pyridinivorans]|uniref:hypothetical protein n=1 Tax=Rhodococcus pyridinivorans TaxID=103816 RepID=UPI003D7F9B54
MTRPPAKCGTTSGYMRHYKRGEAYCQPCLDARRDYDRRKRVIQRSQALRDTGVTLPAIAFAEVYLASPPAVQELIERHIGIDIADELVAIHDQYQDLKDKAGAA